MKINISFVLFISFVLINTSFTKFCSPVRTPFNKLIENFNPKNNTAVEGYFVDENKFKITRSYESDLKIGTEKEVFEYGPFGSDCELYELPSNVDTNLIGLKNKRMLFLYKNRSKDGKLVTPIFHGNGVSIINKSKVVFEQYINSEKDPSTVQKYQFSTSLISIRNIIEQKTKNNSVNWNKKLITKSTS